MAVAPGRVGRFVVEQEIFHTPLVGAIARVMGAIPVDRCSGADTPLVAAARASAAGEIVASSRWQPSPDAKPSRMPNSPGRRGVAVLSRMSGAPVVPMSLWHTDSVWPRSARMPAARFVLDPPTVRVRVGKPIGLRSADDDATVRSVLRAVERLLPDKASRPRPTTADIARPYPRGASAVAR